MPLEHGPAAGHCWRLRSRRKNLASGPAPRPLPGQPPVTPAGPPGRGSGHCPPRARAPGAERPRRARLPPRRSWRGTAGGGFGRCREGGGVGEAGLPPWNFVAEFARLVNSESPLGASTDTSSNLSLLGAQRPRPPAHALGKWGEGSSPPGACPEQAAEKTCSCRVCVREREMRWRPCWKTPKSPRTADKCQAEAGLLGGPSFDLPCKASLGQGDAAGFFGFEGGAGGLAGCPKQLSHHPRQTQGRRIAGCGSCLTSALLTTSNYLNCQFGCNRINMQRRIGFKLQL